MQRENFNKNQKHAEAKNHVIVGREIYINLFSPGIFDTDENKNLIFGNSAKNIYSEEIKRTASELHNMLNKKNQNVSAETIRKLYEAFAKFRYACACYLTGQKDDGDIYNYFKYDPWASNKKIRDLKSQIYKTEKDLDADLNMFLNSIDKSGNARDIYKALGTKIFHLEKTVQENTKNINKIQQKLISCNRLIDELEVKSEEYKWRWNDIFTWALYDESSVTREYQRRDTRSEIQEKIESLKSQKNRLSNKLNELLNQNNELQNLQSENKINEINAKFSRLEESYSAIEKEKCRIFRDAHPELVAKLNNNDEEIMDVIFKIERQQALLSTNEVFFKNMILKSRNENFLKRLKGKSFNELLRDEDSHLVNFISDTCKCIENGVQKHEKEGQKVGVTESTYKIEVGGQNYFIKTGELFLDTLDEKSNAVTGKSLKDLETVVQMELYRGNMTEQIYDLKNKKYLNNAEAKQNLIDTASHNLVINAFATIFDFGVDVLVQSEKITSPTGYNIVMKQAKGQALEKLINNYGDDDGRWFCTADAEFILSNKNNYKDQFKMKQKRLDAIREDEYGVLQVANCFLQNEIIEINILNYIFSNADPNHNNVLIELCGVQEIDLDISCATKNQNEHMGFIMYMKEDLPNLIPYATKAHYDFVKNLVTPQGKKLVADTVKTWIKTANQETLDSVIKVIMERIDELNEHFDELRKQKKILDKIEDFDSKTAKAMAWGSINLKGARLERLKRYGSTNVFNGPGAVFFSKNIDPDNYAIEPKKGNKRASDRLL